MEVLAIGGMSGRGRNAFQSSRKVDESFEADEGGVRETHPARRAYRVAGRMTIPLRTGT